MDESKVDAVGPDAASAPDLPAAASAEPAAGRRGPALDPRGLLTSWRQPSPWRLPLAVFAWAQIVLFLWWLGDFPGLLSADSVRYVIHVTSGPWTADHSVVYDSSVLLSVTLVHNVWLLSLVQTTIAAAVLAYFVASMRVIGVRGLWAMLPALVLPVLPPFGAFVSTVWKDVPFALGEILVTATTMRLLALRRSQGGETRGARRYLIALGLEFLGLVLFRNDGFVVLTGIVVVLLIVLSGSRVKLIGLGIGAVAVMLLAQHVIYPAAGIKPAGSSLSYGLFYADVAVAYKQHPHSFTAADKTLMKQVEPLSGWRHAGANCYSGDPLFRNKKYDAAAADRVRGRLLSLWVRVAKRTPGTVVRTRLCRGSVAWNPVPSPRDQANFGEVVVDPVNAFYEQQMTQNHIPLNLDSEPLIPAIGHAAHSLRTWAAQHVLQPVMWRPAIWCYLAYLALLVAGWRVRRWSVLAVGAVVLSNQLAVTALNPAQLYRYMAGPLFLGMLLIPIVALRRSPAAPSAGLGDGSNDEARRADPPGEPVERAGAQAPPS